MVNKPSERFPLEHRVAGTREYRAIYEGGRKIYSESFVLFGTENRLEHHRLGLTVTRKIGGAVVRNRLKRLFREVFRKSSTEIPNHFDLIVNAKRNCVKISYVQLRKEFIAAARRLCR